MPTLHIEHAVSDLATWQSAYDRFAEVRAQSGVLAARVQQPYDDPHYVVIDLEFETTEAAVSFLAILQTRVWSNRENSPALVGLPQARILVPAGSAERQT